MRHLLLLLILLLSISVAIAEHSPVAWCAAQQLPITMKQGCNPVMVLQESMEVLSWINTHRDKERNVLTCQASGTHAARWTTSCLFTSAGDAKVFEQTIRELASDANLLVTRVQQGREACNYHPELRCMRGNLDPILHVTIEILDI